jgi:hypothetical protein
MGEMRNANDIVAENVKVREHRRWEESIKIK